MSTLQKSYFESLQKIAFAALRKNEHLFITMDGELSQFIRINRAKVRQAGSVQDAQLSLIFLLEDKAGLRRTSSAFSLSGNVEVDHKKVAATVEWMRTDAALLPLDPYAQTPETHASVTSEKKGDLLSPYEAVEVLLAPFKEVDLVGIYASGQIVRGLANSAGLAHWFKTESFLLDYSLYTADQRALKSVIGGQKWDSGIYQKRITGEVDRLKLLERKPKKLAPADYRVYLAPHALAELVGMFSWGCVSEASLRQGDSVLRKVRSGEKKFSPLFNLSEDFRRGDTPRWNEEGDLAPEHLEIISQGELKNTLVSTRTSREYKVPSNGATSSEGLRCPSITPGTLSEANALKDLGTGIFLSNLHYLNWSDQPEGRITGMTRYACFWVENGEIVSPIENLRFDDTLFRLFGTELVGFTDQAHWIPETSTYGMRSLGSMSVPGALISAMKFTL